MCTLFRVKPSREEIAGLFRARLPLGLVETCAELFPKRAAAVVRRASSGEVTLDAMRWGFPPPAAGRAPVVNVRNLASPFWRTALASPGRRCLVPVSEFCEWEGEKGAKRQRWFRLIDRETFAFAGIWRPVPPIESGAGAGTTAAFALLTTDPNPLVAPIHPQAMPVILHAEDHATWLDGDLAAACALAAPFPSQLMAVD
jgi:putative SOS response-associated peptidase YedK